MDPSVFAIFMVFGIPMLVIITSHRRKMLEMKLKSMDRGDDSVRIAVEQLRSEVRSLRDTSTQYDLSFDNALQRIERRVETLETHAITSRHETPQRVDLHSGR